MPSRSLLRISAVVEAIFVRIAEVELAMRARRSFVSVPPLRLSMTFMTGMFLADAEEPVSAYAREAEKRVAAPVSIDAITVRFIGSKRYQKCLCVNFISKNPVKQSDGRSPTALQNLISIRSVV
jgi:hypothetical protein